jgi:hypothetical protein
VRTHAWATCAVAVVAAGWATGGYLVTAPTDFHHGAHA